MTAQFGAVLPSDKDKAVRLPVVLTTPLNSCSNLTSKVFLLSLFLVHHNHHHVFVFLCYDVYFYPCSYLVPLRYLYVGNVHSQLRLRLHRQEELQLWF